MHRGKFDEIAKAYGCDINVSASRLGDAYIYWISDLRRVLDADTDERTVELDHFKHASFLSFWLRRHVPIGHIFHNPKPPVPKEATDQQKFFSLYGNEICALRIGLAICHAYETKRFHALIEKAEGQSVVQLRDLRSQLIGSEFVAPDLEIDIVTTMKHKNNSPHSMNLIFRSIFMRYRSPLKQA